MGARLLKRWIALPLKDIVPLNERLDVVEYFIESEDDRTFFTEKLKMAGDLERIISKVAAQRVSPREMLQLRIALGVVGPLQEKCRSSKVNALHRAGEQLNPCDSVRLKIEKTLKEDSSNQIVKGNVISPGVSEELDELRRIMFSGKDYLVELQQREIERTGITSLKVAFNNVFGYYIEVRNTHKSKVPPEWVRKQTLVSAERYITDELKEYETKILGAEEKALALEIKIFDELVQSVNEFIPAIQLNAVMLARLDCLSSFAGLAIHNNYKRPVLNESFVIDIKQGRHPVIEKQLPVDESYIANDVYLDVDDQQVIILTGPNMSGKSALLRQTALIVLMAQIGCYVPAESADIGIVDKIFTRVGASDNISLGESTFMVEMLEAASILNNLSERSLILLDEIGRGTSTYDGISIAWAMVEYIHEHPRFRGKTMFATHYHELNEMESSFSRVKNFHVSVKEQNDKVLFIRKLARGGSEHSFGIHVARMAGMPRSVVKRADEILKELEKSHEKKTLTKPVSVLGLTAGGISTKFFPT
jgi:DNA mismatch repair protein MutS